MQKLANSLSAKLYKSKSIDDILKVVDTSTPLFDLSLALRVIANLAIEQKRVSNPSKIVLLQDYMIQNFYRLKSKEILNVVYFLRAINELNLSKNQMTCIENNYHKIIEIMVNKSIPISQIIGLFYDLNRLKLNNYEYNSYLIELLKDPNVPITLIHTKVILNSIADRICYFNREIADICYKRLIDYSFTPIMIKEVIDLIDLIFINEINLVCKANLLLIAKIDDYIKSCDIRLVDFSQAFKIFKNHNRKSVLLDTFSRLFCKKLGTVGNLIDEKLFVEFAEIFHLATDLSSEQISISIDAAKRFLLNVEHIDESKAIILSNLYKFGKFNIEFDRCISIEQSPITKIYFIKGSLYSNLKSAIFNQTIHQLGNIESMHFEELLDAFKLTSDDSIYNSDELKVYCERLCERIVELTIENEQNFYLFSKFIGNSNDAVLRRRVQTEFRKMFNQLSKKKLQIQTTLLRSAINIYCPSKEWYEFADSIANRITPQIFSDFLKSSHVKSLNFNGLLYFYKKTPHKKHRDVVNMIFLMLENSLT